MLGPNSNDSCMPMAWSSTPIGRSPDWVFSEASSTHLTNDRSWFEADFTEFESHISNSRASIANIPVKGVGTVVLPVKQSLAGQGTSAGASLRLENVLYVPDYPCNVIGSPIRALASIQFTSLTPRGAMVYGDGSIAAIFMPGRDFYQVMLRETPMGPPLGRSVLDEHPEYGFMVGFTWSDLEQQRWRSLQASLRAPPRLANPAAANRLSFTLGQAIRFESVRGVEQPWPPASNRMEVDTQSRTRKRGADDEMDCSPRRVKRTRAMDESNFSPQRSLPMFSARG